MAHALTYKHERMKHRAWRWVSQYRTFQRPRFRRFLDPLERSSEVLFGIVMVLAYTASISVASGGGEDVRSVLIGAIGCNLAWGIVDAAMYLMGTFAERARGLMTLRAIRRSSDPDESHRLIAEVLPPALVDMLTDADFEVLRRRMSGSTEPNTSLRFDDYMAAAGVFLLVFVSTWPVIIPFVVMHDAVSALRVSQLVAMALLFAVGWRLGRYAGRPAWRTGLSMAAIGAAFGALTFVLGG